MSRYARRLALWTTASFCGAFVVRRLAPDIGFWEGFFTLIALLIAMVCVSRCERLGAKDDR